MFANYRVDVIPSKAKVKFEFVEEKQHPDYALLGDVLDDIKKRTSGLIAERKQLTAENARLIDRVQWSVNAFGPSSKKSTRALP